MSYENEKLMGYDPRSGTLVEVAATIDQPSPNMIRIRHTPSTDLAVIQSHRSLEVLIAAHGYDSYRFKVEAAASNQEIVLSRSDARTFLIEYRNVLASRGSDVR